MGKKHYSMTQLLDEIKTGSTPITIVKPTRHSVQDELSVMRRYLEDKGFLVDWVYPDTIKVRHVTLKFVKVSGASKNPKKLYGYENILE